MLRSVGQYSPQLNNNNFNNNVSSPKVRCSSFKPLTADTIAFRGMSKPSQYNNVFEFLAAKILFNKKNLIEEEKLSATNIKQGVEEVFQFNGVYGPFTKTQANLIKWRPYVPQDIREYSAQKVNEARAERLGKWKDILQHPENHYLLEDNPELATKIKNNKSLRIVAWNAVNSELKNNDRHIPVPFNAKALEQTVADFESIQPLSRKTRCKDISFLDMYTHRLRDNILEERGLSEHSEAVWVKIPSYKHDPKNFRKNVSDVEVLSYKNWCTRSSVDKAEDVLKDGDFYIYLERGKNDFWQPLIGMASYENKISQIQGVENNNVVPIKHLDKINKFIKEKGLQCQSGVVDEGPKALQQLLISEKLREFRPEINKTFDKALKDNDSINIFKYLDKSVKENENGLLEIGTYKPVFVADSKKGITVPYNMMGVNEDTLLEKVEKIKGDLILNNKNFVYNSTITQFPPNLKEVTGKISCTKEQYEKFGEQLSKLGKVSVIY